MNTTELLSAIDTEIATLRQARALLIGDDGHRAAPGPKLAKRIMSAEGRARIAAAQKGRWAKQNTAKKSSGKPPRKAVKRIMSAEGRARIVAAQRKRWEAQKGTAKKTA